MPAVFFKKMYFFPGLNDDTNAAMIVQVVQKVNGKCSDNQIQCKSASAAASLIMNNHFTSLIQAVLKSDNSKSTAAALFYGTCSISMNFLNKAVVSSYNFNYPFFIMVCQMVTTIVFLDTLRYYQKQDLLINFVILMSVFLTGWPAT
jgi:hypothetical protein